MSSRWPTSIQMRRALRRWMRRWMRIFYNIVSLWYMVSRLHTISSKVLYGRKNYNTIEKKILYGKNFFTITIPNNNCKNFLPYYHTIFIAAIFCRPLLIHASEITVFFFKHTILSGCEKSKIGRNRKDSFEYICLGKFTCHTHNLIS